MKDLEKIKLKNGLGRVEEHQAIFNISDSACANTKLDDSECYGLFNHTIKILLSN